MPGDKYASIKRPRVYRALRRRGYSKSRAAAIANSQGSGKAARYGHIEFTPPAGVRAAARRGLQWRQEYGRGGTDVGVARARDLSNGVTISPETARRMNSFFARHGTNRSEHYALQDGKPTTWRIAWELWGGDAGRAWANKLGRQMDAADRTDKTAATFAVFKQANGAYRWLAVSSTAYRDRDGEIVSSTALKQAVASADATGNRGPLLFWHVPGVVLGDCDFQATAFDGRALIESGTFRSERIAGAVARKASSIGMTIGFTHPLTEPDPSGVFETIDIFERSIAPANRVSNKFTRLAVHKEAKMTMTDEKAQALKTLFADAPELVEEWLANAEQTDKALQQSGVAHKATADSELLARLLAQVDKTTKEEKQEDADVDVDVSDDGPILTRADVQMLVDAIGDAVADRVLSKMDEMSSKMAAYDEEMKARGYQRMKEVQDASDAAVTKEAETREAAITALKEQITAMATKLAELEGDQPAARSYRASQAKDTDVSAKVARYDDPVEAAANWLFAGNGRIAQ